MTEAAPGVFLSYASRDADAARRICEALRAGGMRDVRRNRRQAAEAYAVFGQPDQAFEWLEKARVRHDTGLIYLRGDPLLASLEKDPRFRALLRTVNLPE